MLGDTNFPTYIKFLSTFYWLIKSVGLGLFNNELSRICYVQHLLFLWFVMSKVCYIQCLFVMSNIFYVLGLLCLAFVSVEFVISSVCLSRVGYGTVKLLKLMQDGVNQRLSAAQRRINEEFLKRLKTSNHPNRKEILNKFTEK